MGFDREKRPAGAPKDRGVDAELAQQVLDEHQTAPPGKRTLIEQHLAESLAEGARSRIAVGRQTLLDQDSQPPAPASHASRMDLAAWSGSAFDDFRSRGLREVLAALALMRDQRGLMEATLWSAKRDQRSARPTLTSRPAPPDPAGQAMWRAAERRAATLYRRAVDSGDVETEDPAVEQALARAGGGQPLPAAVRRKMELQLGIALDRVRIHTDAVAADAARVVRASAFTVGEDIFFANGAYAPETPAGQKLLAHELTHVVQAYQGRTATGGERIQVSSSGESLEREADAVAGRIGNSRAIRTPIPSAGKGGGAPLPGPVRARMESAFDVDLSEVRIHEGSEAEELDALAYAQGTDIHFAAGRYAPGSTQGLELLGHELAHVVQQSQGRVEGTHHAKGASVNDDPALEYAADVLGARAARGEPAAMGAAGGVTGANAVQRKPAAPAPIDGESLSLPAAGSAQGQPVQLAGNDKKPPTYVPHKIKVTKPMTGEEFKQAALLQVFGGPVAATWQGIKDSYPPDNSPYTLQVELGLLQRHRTEVSRAKGMDIDPNGAKENAQELDRAPSGEKEALLAEIDKRYYAATGADPGITIKHGETGKAELWKTIRDEVLFQHKYIANLPPSVKRLITQSTQGKDLTPADYEQLFRIAKKIEALPQGQAADYASKVTGTTTDLNVFEAGLEKYAAEMAKRSKEKEEHNKTAMKLAGLEEVYKQYRSWRTLQIISPALGAYMKKELENELKVHNFAGVAELEAYIEKFERGFELESAKIVEDLLTKYAGRLHREGERYKDQKEVSALHGKLGGVRKQFGIFEQQSQIMEQEHAKQAPERERARLPGHGGQQPKPTAAFKDAEAKALAARSASAAEIKGLEREHPIFQNDDQLPLDRRIDKTALAKADENQLGGVLNGYIAKRTEAVNEARGELQGKSELIYKMDKLMPQFYQQQNIAPGSIHDLIIKDKMKEDAIKRIVVGILLAIAAIALTIVSLGTATPAIVAAGAAAGAFGLSAYMAYDEYKTYTQDQKLADVGLVDDPSVVWLVLAVAGAALDMGAAVKAVRALGPAAKAINAGGEISQFNKVVRTLEHAGEIDAKIARAAEKAAAAKKGYAEASGELAKILGGRTYSFPGPFTDPDVYKQLVKMAAAKFKEIGNNGLIFIEEVKKARVLAKLGDMTPEELAKVKQAWEEGVKQADDAGKAIAPGADKIAELKRTLSPALAQVNDLSGSTLVMLDKLDKSILPKFKSASAADLERLGSMLVEDPTLAERLVKYKNPYGALIKSKNVVEMDRALLMSRLSELKVNAARMGPAIDKSGISAADLAKLTDDDIKALGKGDRLLGEARQGFGPSAADASKLADAGTEFDKVAGVSNAARDDLRASIAHSHGLSDLPFIRNPGEALAAKFPDIPKASMDALAKRHPDALRALESASKEDVQRVIKAFEESANPKDVEDILRSYMYKAQKKARKPIEKGGTEGLDAPDNVGERIGESVDNLAQARKRGHPFGFKDKAQYEQFISTVDSEVASRGIKGKAKVQGSAMHSKTPGDIDMEIVVDQAEFDRLAKRFLEKAPDPKDKQAVKTSIAKKKIPSYEFFPDDDPSIASAVKQLTQGADEKPLDVQATLIVRGSDFDLGPFL